MGLICYDVLNIILTVDCKLKKYESIIENIPASYRNTCYIHAGS